MLPIKKQPVHYVTAKQMEGLYKGASEVAESVNMRTRDVYINVDHPRNHTTDGYKKNLVHGVTHLFTSTLEPKKHAKLVKYFTKSPEWPQLKKMFQMGLLYGAEKPEMTKKMKDSDIVDELLAVRAEFVITANIPPIYAPPLKPVDNRELFGHLAQRIEPAIDPKYRHNLDLIIKNVERIKKLPKEIAAEETK